MRNSSNNKCLGISAYPVINDNGKDHILRALGRSAVAGFSRLVHPNLQLIVAFLLCTVAGVNAQEHRIAQEIAARDGIFQSLQPLQILELKDGSTVFTENLEQTIRKADFLKINSTALVGLLARPAENLIIQLPLAGKNPLNLRLKQSNIFTPSFQATLASDRSEPYRLREGRYYWGVIEGEENSLVALAITPDEIMGFIQIGQQKYTLGKMENRTDGLHILYAVENLLKDPGIACHVDDETHFIGTDTESSPRQGPDNCVRMYIEVDYDIFLGKGGAQQASDYVLGAFSQVAVLYANESIEFVINELLVWDVPDPYTGPNTNNYLDQFRNYQGGNFNGDLAHLVGYNGGGGIAYVDVLCNNYYGVGYSAINPSYNNVPTYSWTVEVLTHEIGHNLGSHHTHSCVWNGNNTAIDGCGPAAGYSDGCNGPLPVSGTIMSYCHLLNGVGINFNNGFGPQPGDLIRNRVYNASCLAACGPPILYDAGIIAILAPVDNPCENNLQPIVTLQNFGSSTLTSVTINYQLDNGANNTYNWTGSLAQNATTDVTLPSISYSVGAHTFQSFTTLPNGQPDEVPSNDGSNSSFTYIEDYCVCNAATTTITPNPLTHTGGGQSSAIKTFDQGSKNVSFVISGLGAKLNGSQNSRFNERVVVSYTDGNGGNQSYGTFLGSQQSTVNVTINGFVNSVTVTLNNSLNNGYTGTLSVSFSTIDFCSPQPPCPDADGDGVCDADDICPGFDDNLIGTACNDNDACTSNDVYTTECICAGVPIPGCGEECSNPITSQFTPNPRTHVGTGSSTSSVSFPVGNTDVTFTVSNLNAVLNGNPSQRYNDKVVITYVNGAMNTILYGEFLGSQGSSVNVAIPGAVKSVTLALSDGYDGNAGNIVLSVSMSAVTSCLPAPIFGGSVAVESGRIELYPNPASHELFIRFPERRANGQVRLLSTLGVLINEFKVIDQQLLRIDLDALKVGDQMLFIQILEDGMEPKNHTVFIRN